MCSDDLKIVVAGDVIVDWYFWKRPPDSNNKNIHWKLYSGYNIYPQLGGAILLSYMLRESLRQSNQKILIADQKPEKFDQSNPWDLSLIHDHRKALHTNIKLDLFPDNKSDLKNQVYRVKNFLGFTTPPIDNDYPDPLEIINDDENAEFVLIQDVGNGFRNKRDIWPKAIIENGSPTIIHYMNPPLFEGDFWEHIKQNCSQKLILILNAEDLRKLGANISRSLSWEKTALDFIWEVNNNKKLEEIKELPNVIVRFGLEGAIHYNGVDKNIGSNLYFDPSSVEEGFWDDKKFGTMKSISSVFVSSLTCKFISSTKEGNTFNECLKKGIEFGLLKSREFIKIGHRSKTTAQKNIDPIFFDQICENLFNNGKTYDTEGNDHIECVKLPPAGIKEPDPDFWSILKENTKNKNKELVDTAIEIVKRGSCALTQYPAGYFGKLTTVDRAEIESYRSIMNIMEGYINSEKTSRPLSIAVFGYPGSGKSFGITEVAKVIDPENVYKIDFNVSQFTSVEDLINAFHRIRDVSLQGKIPLVFFDEFDCKFENRPLGWLKYFLEPMQEGEFMDYGSMHPIGKSIFVFAGGIYKSFQDFCENTGIHSIKQKDSKENQTSTSREFSSEKCPDFVSRLRGYVNILGPNKIEDNDNDDNDDAYIIRRAIILRSLIEGKVPNIITKRNRSDNGEFDNRVNGKANIDESLLRALLIIPEYKHGARSMEAIIDMSMLRKYTSWEKAYLPPADQLELHLDKKEISTLLAKK